MGKKPQRAAATLDELASAGETVVSRVPFLRTDARAMQQPAGKSKSKMKQAFASDLEPNWPAASAEASSHILGLLGVECGSGDGGRNRASCVCLGRSAVARALKRNSLAALILAKDAGVPLLYSHLAVLAQASGTPVCVVACSSAQLGQPFGLLRASAVGLRKEHFVDAASSELMRRVLDCSPTNKPPRLLLWTGESSATGASGKGNSVSETAAGQKAVDDS